MTAAFYGNLDDTPLKNSLEYRMYQVNLHFFFLFAVLFCRDSQANVADNGVQESVIAYHVRSREACLACVLLVLRTIHMVQHYR